MEETISLELGRYEAKELAEYLAGVDMHLSVGDRYLLALKIMALLREDEESDEDILYE
jgi:DNA primase catalytic subunit